ncbi:hypothetical protein ACTMTJ_21315 [Phytohabitans sp. LJ34]|uniref:hypothetical protein n=1 Tax=Phytohabitans sp. LJ34 TaxID=3452217 RepID=UPI003F8B20E0
MSSYRDPALRGAVYPSEEEIEPAGAGVEPVYDSEPGPRPARAAASAPPREVDTQARSIVSRHPDGSVEVVTDFDGDGIADVVQLDLDGDGVPDVTYIDRDRDGRLDTVLRTPEN